MAGEFPNTLSSSSSSVTVPTAPALNPDQLWEYVEDVSPAGGSLSFEQSSQSITFIIPNSFTNNTTLSTGLTVNPNGTPNRNTSMSRLYEAVALLLGYTYTEDLTFVATSDITSPILAGSSSSGTEIRKVLRRYLPMSHPLFPWLVCTRIDGWKGIGPQGKAVATAATNYINAGLNLPSFTSKYKIVQITAVFTQPPYNLLTDSWVQQNGFNESVLSATGTAASPGRFIWREQSPSANMITIDQGSMVFTEGPAQGKSFTAPGYSQMETKQLYTFHWTQVPEEYVCNQWGDPVRLDAALQCVNSTTFMGRRAGTLLMEPYRITRYRVPLIGTGRPRFWLHIELNFKFFDPIAYYGSNVGISASNPFGPDFVSEATGTVVQGEYDITGVNAYGITKAQANIGNSIGGFGIPNSARIVSVAGSTITMNVRAFNNQTNAVLSMGRTKFGHLTAPAGLRGYFHFETAANSFGGPNRDRYQSYDFNQFFYPLTASERAG